MIKSIQTKYYLQSIALRSNSEQHTEHADNCYFYIVELENRSRVLTKMVNDKERELILRAVTVLDLESEVLTLKNELSSADQTIAILEETNAVLLKSVETKF